MKKNTKIAIYSGVIPSTTFIERLIHELSKNDVRVYLFGQKTKPVKKSKNIYYITYSNRVHKFLLFLKYTLLLLVFKAKEKKKLDKIIRSKKKNLRHLKTKYYPVLYHHPDIFHLQWAKSVEDWMWVQNFGIKLVVSLRGAHINYSPITDKNLANSYTSLFPEVDHFHAVSKAIKNEAIKYNAPEKKIKVVYSGLDLNAIKFHEKLFASKTPLHIISVGRAHWIKGYTYALKSIHQLKKMNVSCHYTIIGATNNEELLYQRWLLGLENDVQFIDKMPFKNVLQAIKKADVLLLPSLKEGIANVVLEAMALGTLVVSTDCGGMHEVIVDSKNGFLVPTRNPNAIANSLKEVANLPLERYLNMTKEARKTVTEQHNISKTMQDMQDLYAEVLKE